jgi:hypothetical protein
VNDFFPWNDKRLRKETEEETNKWKDITCSWTRRCSIVKIAILSKLIYRFSFNPYQYNSDILHKIEKRNPKICMEPQKIPSSQSKIKQKSWRYHVISPQTILQNREHKQIHVFITIWLLTKMPGTQKRNSTVSLINSSGKAWYPNAEEWT